MRKILLTLVIGLLIVSCGNKNKGNEETQSGLLPANFEQRTETGKLNKLYVMKNAAGMEVAVINMGARIVSAVVPDKDGNMVNVIAGYEDLQPYLQLKDYTGAVLGRYAGRISGGEISVDRVTYRLRTNESTTMLNGGPRGFSTQYFDVEQTAENTLVCSYFSMEKEEGFPGNLNLTVTYKLTEDNALDITYEATTTRATPLNVTNQLHFNLSGVKSESIANHSLFVNAASYVDVDQNKIPTGKLLSVKDNNNFTTAKILDTAIAYDEMFVLNKSEEAEEKAAQLVSSTTGVKVEVYTTEPGIQLYTTTDKPVVILQTQHFPDSPHQPEFPSTYLSKDSTFYSNTVYKFGIEK
ncbi:galactose mutarotase [Bacteroidales bacterium OttesenSCG-928-M06]|nr:galactose mutarotase [Bacteroidales bacterium OttesenSCG-928-M06]